MVTSLLAGALAFSLPGTKAPQQQFNVMLAGVTLPEAALACVESSTYRTLLRGTAAVNNDPLVRRSFQILYEDLAFFRPAGNVLIGQLAKCASEAQAVCDSLEALFDSVLDSVPLDSVLPWLRDTFDSIDTSGDGALDPEELRRATMAGDQVAAAAALCLELEECDVEPSRAITFTEFVSLVGPAQATAAAAATAVAVSTASDVADPAASPTAAVAGSGDGWGGRFDRMAQEFGTWEAEGEAAWDGRRAEVIAGCFAGARNEALLEALRLVYCEYAVLRKAGDLVFRMLRPPSARRA